MAAWRRAGLFSGIFLTAAAVGGGSTARADAKRPLVDPQAIAALDRMGAFLRAQNSMKVTAEMTTDEVLDNGQKVQRQGVATLEVSRPDRLRADVVSDRRNEQLFYDGKTFTIYQPALGYYGSFK